MRKFMIFTLMTMLCVFSGTLLFAEAEKEEAKREERDDRDNKRKKGYAQ